MRDIRLTILKLICDYLDKQSIIKNIIVMSTGQKTITRIMLQRASVAWHVTDRAGKPDDKQTNDILEIERVLLANKLYDLVHGILSIRGKLRKFEEKERRRTLTTHEEKVNWSIKAALWADIISEYDIIPQEEELDEAGDLVGYRKVSKPKLPEISPEDLEDV